MINIKEILDIEIIKRDNSSELEKLDPVIIARKYKDEYISLICALFAYGNVKQILKLLNSFDFSILGKSEEIIKSSLKNNYYRFQTSEDIINFFISLSRLKKKNLSLENIFYNKYKINFSVLEGIDGIIEAILEINSYRSRGYKFLISSSFKRDKQENIKEIGNSPYKRYNLFLRWMIRKDNIDIGLWNKIDKKDLIIPLDTHTFNICKKLNLLTRKTYDLKSALLITEKLREFSNSDPIKYDFAIYRIGQEKIFTSTFNP